MRNEWIRSDAAHFPDKLIKTTALESNLRTERILYQICPFTLCRQRNRLNLKVLFHLPTDTESRNSSITRHTRDLDDIKTTAVRRQIVRLINVLIFFIKGQKDVTRCRDPSRIFTVFIRLPRSRRSNSWHYREKQVVPSECSLYNHTLTELSWKRKLEILQLQENWEEKSLDLRTYIVIVNVACFLRCTWTSSKWHLSWKHFQTCGRYWRWN